MSNISKTQAEREAVWRARTAPLPNPKNVHAVLGVLDYWTSESARNEYTDAERIAAIDVVMAQHKQAVNVPTRSPLTAEEVEQLPDGEPIRVTWSGGNGPHEYVVAVDKYGQRHAARNTDPDDRLRWYNPLRFVGTERYHTRVWKAVDA